MSDITRETWKELTAANPDAVIIDVRTDDEVADGMIPNALHHDIFNAQGFMEALESLDKSKEYYIYCRSGNRSGQACQIMQQLGFEKTYNLLEGFSAWDGEVQHV